jgi:hypothetical protein
MAATEVLRRDRDPRPLRGCHVAYEDGKGIETYTRKRWFMTIWATKIYHTIHEA